MAEEKTEAEAQSSSDPMPDSVSSDKPINMDGEKAEAEPEAEAKPNSASADKKPIVNTDGEKADAEAKSSSAPKPNSASADNASGNTVKLKKKKSRRKLRKTRAKAGGKIAQLALKLDPSKIGCANV